MQIEFTKKLFYYAQDAIVCAQVRYVNLHLWFMNSIAYSNWWWLEISGSLVFFFSIKILFEVYDTFAAISIVLDERIYCKGTMDNTRNIFDWNFNCRAHFLFRNFVIEISKSIFTIGVMDNSLYRTKVSILRDKWLKMKKKKTITPLPIKEEEELPMTHIDFRTLNNKK